MKVAYIEWIDACGTDKYHEKVAIPKDQSVGLQTNWSVGIIIADTKEYIALAQSLSESGWYRDIINIPKVNIKSEKVLL